MSEREQAIDLINTLPGHKIGYALAYLQGLCADEAAGDEFCANLLEEYNNSDDKGEFVSLEEAVRLCGVEE